MVETGGSEETEGTVDVAVGVEIVDLAGLVCVVGADVLEAEVAEAIGMVAADEAAGVEELVFGLAEVPLAMADQTGAVGASTGGADADADDDDDDDEGAEEALAEAASFAFCSFFLRRASCSFLAFC